MGARVRVPYSYRSRECTTAYQPGCEEMPHWFTDSEALEVFDDEGNLRAVKTSNGDTASVGAGDWVVEDGSGETYVMTAQDFDLAWAPEYYSD